MTTWQKIGIGIAAFVAFVGLLLAVVFWATSGASKTLDDFFHAVGRDDYPAAHTFVSEELRRSTTPGDLRGFMESNGIVNVTNTSWSSRSVSGNLATFEGSVTTASGAEIPTKVELVKEAEVWRIHSFDIKAPGFKAAPEP